MNNITFMQSVELIDIAAKEDRLWHHNGGQAYIRVSNDSQVLMIIDHTMSNRIPEITLHDGTDYFKACAGAQFEYSRRMREHETTMVEYFSKYFTDILPLETV
jgi:hypothetical protein